MLSELILEKEKDKELRFLEQLDTNLIEDLITYVGTLPQKKGEFISKLINRKIRQKFPNRKERKYGNLSRSIKTEDIEKLISISNNSRMELAIKFMFKLGLRESEVVVIRINDINLDTWLIKINNFKCNREEIMIIPTSLRADIETYIKKYDLDIKKNNNCLFFSNNPVWKRNHISKDWLRNTFRELTLKAGINIIYGMTSESKKKDKNGKLRTPRTQYLYTVHSLRHSFGNRFYEKSNFDIRSTMKALRHRDVNTTMTYVNENNVFSILESM